VDLTILWNIVTCCLLDLKLLFGHALFIKEINALNIYFFVVVGMSPNKLFVAVGMSFDIPP
jgi:hypothetical protein